MILGKGSGILALCVEKCDDSMISCVEKCSCMDRKISIRFYKDREVRAVWDGELNKWWFSVLDIIGVCKRLRVYTLHNSKKAVTAD
mgnify:CR=1 FL=1